MATMKKLLKDYNFGSDIQYHEMIADSFINGNHSQAVNQFKALPKKDKITLLKSITIYGWYDGVFSKQRIETLFDNV